MKIRFKLNEDRPTFNQYMDKDNYDVGTKIEIADKNGEYLHIGDYVRFGDTEGRLLYSPYMNEFAVMNIEYKLRSGDEFDPKSYSSFVVVPLNNTKVSQHLEKLKDYNS